MNELVLIFTRDQLLNILTGLELEQVKQSDPSLVFRIRCPATPDGVSVAWGKVTFAFEPEREVTPAK